MSCFTANSVQRLREDHQEQIRSLHSNYDFIQEVQDDSCSECLINTVCSIHNSFLPVSQTLFELISAASSCSHLSLSMKCCEGVQSAISSWFHTPRTQPHVNQRQQLKEFECRTERWRAPRICLRVWIIVQVCSVSVSDKKQDEAAGLFCRKSVWAL